MPEFIRRGTNATIFRHSAIHGTRFFDARTYEMLPPKEYPSHEVAVVLRFKRPRSRLWEFVYIVPCGHAYYTIEKDDENIYDSRTEVPCDMPLFDELSRLVEESGYADTVWEGLINLELESYEPHLLFGSPPPRPSRLRKRRTSAEIVNLETRRQHRRR